MLHLLRLTMGSVEVVGWQELWPLTWCCVTKVKGGNYVTLQLENVEGIDHCMCSLFVFERSHQWWGDLQFRLQGHEGQMSL